jgi:hypothetical protein
VPTVARINCGGSEYTDSSSNVWAADPGPDASNGDGTHTYGAVDMAGTDLETVYLSERYAFGLGAYMQYEIAIDNGTYDVRLLMCESHYTVTNNRSMTIEVNDVEIESDYNPFDAAGGKDIPADVIVNDVVVTGGEIKIYVAANVPTESAELRGIAITPAGGGGGGPVIPVFVHHYRQQGIC